jgi:hypothetical protein
VSDLHSRVFQKKGGSEIYDDAEQQVGEISHINTPLFAVQVHAPRPAQSTPDITHLWTKK